MADLLVRDPAPGPDGNPRIYWVGAAGKRHLLGPEFGATKAAGLTPVDMASADLAQIPNAVPSTPLRGTLTFEPT